MKFSIKKLQQGGEVVDPQMQQETSQEGNTASPEEQLMTMSQQIIQELGPEGAALLAQTIMEMLQGAAQPQQPTFQRRGGSLGRKN